MAHVVSPGGGNYVAPGGSGAPGGLNLGGGSSSTPHPAVSSHNVFVTILAEVIGVSILAIIADANDQLGKVAVALMAGWLLLFLITNSTDLSNLAGNL